MSALFRLEGISKRYGGVRALQDASLTCFGGQIHAVLGENGAGKSTLIKIMAGVVQPDSGTMELEGRPVAFRRPAQATEAGIACIFQELSLISDLSVTDNVVITKPPTRHGLIDQRAQRKLTEQALARAGAGDIHPLSLVKDLPLSRRQMVEIAKALVRNPKILILDEATSALTSADVEKVFRVLKQLRSEGLAIIYISHRMHEIAQLADDCTVYRNGRYVATFKAGTKSDAAIVEMMIGREYKSVFPAKPENLPDGHPVLNVRNLSWAGRLSGINLSIKPGEVIGLGGLDGQGQHELLLALFGVLNGVSGNVEVGGKPIHLRSPSAAKSKQVRMALIPEDRKTEGLMLPMSVRDNLSFAAIEHLAKFGLIRQQTETAAVDQMVKSLNVRCDGVDGPVGALSGGNQQKVVIGKWLMTGPRIILLNDPTRGVDVGTKQELYQIFRRLADEGAAILFYSTDYDELIGCCDRVLVLYGGTVVRTLAGPEITEHNLVSSALNLPVNGAEGSAHRELSEVSSDAPLAKTDPAEATRLSDSTELAEVSPQSLAKADPGRADLSDVALAKSEALAKAEAEDKRVVKKRRPDWQFHLAAQRRIVFPVVLFVAMFALYVTKHPAGFNPRILNTAANKGVLLALIAMAQTIPVLTAGIDLSVGMVFVLANCLASVVVVGTPFETALGVCAVVLTGAVCGAINGAIVVFGRLQPIIVTIATGAIYYGFALLLRPAPGGTINTDFGDALVGSLPGGIPVTLILLLAVVFFFWLPFQRSVLGRATYAVGSSEQAAFMSGISIGWTKFFAYLLAGVLAALAGLLLTCLTESGEANAVLGNTYTLNSIAAVVLGGTSLFGGSGGAIGSIFGAFVLRTIGDLLIIFDLDPLWQPLYLGIVLLIAVSLSSLRLLRIKNRLDIYLGG